MLRRAGQRRSHVSTEGVGQGISLHPTRYFLHPLMALLEAFLIILLFPIILALPEVRGIRIQMVGQVGCQVMEAVSFQPAGHVGYVPSDLLDSSGNFFGFLYA